MITHSRPKPLKRGWQKIVDFIRKQVLHLIYTAVDMRPFAIVQGGEPFVWDDEDRRHLRGLFV
ncbi:MAG: hypothetical protein DRR16_33575 [Candidatus Parabeggiatoa sp. nov. 3]|nr:MAG: hypothetical protein DRQ99_07970 [Gammaproteobacteria bacterium]RKZ72909.1 MAG: hypothetical protein DRR16_33575 [Gammaproteobacteria bacterium]